MDRRFSIIEPNERALERLDGLLSDWPGWQCAGRFTSSDLALSDLLADPVDLMFCAVDLGFEAVDQAQGWPMAPAIVALTRDRQLAMPCAERGMAGLLLKPFSVDKCQQLKLRLDRRFAPADLGSLTARGPSGIHRIAMADVIYLYSANKRTWVVTRGAELWLDGALDRWAIQHPDWLRIRRNCLVPIDRIAALQRLESGWGVTLNDWPDCLPVARRALPEIRRRLASLPHSTTLDGL